MYSYSLRLFIELLHPTVWRICTELSLLSVEVRDWKMADQTPSGSGQSPQEGNPESAGNIQPPTEEAVLLPGVENVSQALSEASSGLRRSRRQVEQNTQERIRSFNQSQRALSEEIVVRHHEEENRLRILDEISPRGRGRIADYRGSYKRRRSRGTSSESADAEERKAETPQKKSSTTPGSASSRDVRSRTPTPFPKRVVQSRAVRNLKNNLTDVYKKLVEKVDDDFLFRML